MRSSWICPFPVLAQVPTRSIRLATARLGGALLGGALTVAPWLTPVQAAPVSSPAEGKSPAPAVGVQGQHALPPPIPAVPAPRAGTLKPPTPAEARAIAEEA